MPGELNKLPFLSVLGSIVLVIASLYWAQAVLIPVALAILLTFLLNPVVTVLQSNGLGRAPAAVLVVVLVSVIVLAAGWVTASQMSSLAYELPKYQDNVRQKIADFRHARKGGALEKVQDAVETVTSEFKRDAPPRTALKEPVAVVVESASLLSRAPSMLELLAHAGLVFVLVIFMLIERGTLLDRLIRLVGYSRVTVTTKALEEAGQRISRYLVMQSIIMFRQLLDPARYEVELTRAQMVASELVALVARTGPALVCIGAVPPGGLAQARYRCKLLRARFPDLKIVVGRWGFKENAEETLAQLRADGIDYVGTSLLETRDQVMRLVASSRRL